MGSTDVNRLATLALLVGIVLAMHGESHSQRKWTTDDGVARLNTPSTRIVERRLDKKLQVEIINRVCIFLAVFVGLLDVFNLVTFLRSKRADVVWQIMKMGVAFYCCYCIGGMTMEFWGRPICEISTTSSTSRLERCAEGIQNQYVLGWIGTILNLVSGILYGFTAVAVQKSLNSY